MELTVLTPDSTIFEGAISSLKVPGKGGYFEILENHAPIVAALDSGNVRIRTAEGSDKTFSIEKGFVEVLFNKVSLLVQGVVE